MSDVTLILARIEAGDALAAEQLLPLVYDELRKLAAAKLAQERPGQTLDATGLVHEAYLRLAVRQDGEGEKERRSDGERGKSKPPSVSPSLPLSFPAYDTRGHFFAAAAIAMRRILIDNARRKARIKHGGELKRAELIDAAEPEADERLLALDEALSRLAAEDAQAAQVVELHHFARLSHELVAATLGITVYQARQKWTYARAWLQNALAER